MGRCKKKYGRRWAGEGVKVCKDKRLNPPYLCTSGSQNCAVAANKSV